MDAPFACSPCQFNHPTFALQLEALLELIVLAACAVHTRALRESNNAAGRRRGIKTNNFRMLT